MVPDGPPDAEKRETLRQFAALGAVGPLAAASRVADVDLESERRAAVLEHVERTPGIHFSMLRDELELGTGETQYHLRRLERAGAIVSHTDGEYRRLFVAGVFSHEERCILSALRRHRHGQILTETLGHPGIAAGELASRLDVSTPAISRAAGELERAGLLNRANGAYHVIDPETLLGLVAQFEESFDGQMVSAAFTAIDAGIVEESG